MANNDRPVNLSTKLPKHVVGNPLASSLNGNSNSAEPNPRKRKQEMVHSCESPPDTSNIPGNELSKYKSKSLSIAVDSSIDTLFRPNSPVQHSNTLTNEMRQEFIKSYDTIIQDIIQISDWSKEYITDCLIVLKSAGQEISLQSLWQICEEKYAFPMHRNQPSTFNSISSNGPSSSVGYDQCSYLNQGDSCVNASSFGGHSKFYNQASKKCRRQSVEVQDSVDGAVNYYCDSIPIKDSDETHQACVLTRQGILTCNDLQCDSQAEFSSTAPDVAQSKSGLDSKSQHIKKLLSAVEHEHKLLVAYKQCIACGSNPRGITFLPCGHFVACKSCAVSLLSCPSCNGSIVATVDTFLS